MTDTAREPIAHLWQHKETGRLYYQGPGDEAPQISYTLIGPLFLEPHTVPPREPTPEMFIAGDRAGCTVDQQPSFEAIEAIWRAMYDAALAERGKG